MATGRQLLLIGLLVAGAIVMTLGMVVWGLAMARFFDRLDRSNKFVELLKMRSAMLDRLSNGGITATDIDEVRSLTEQLQRFPQPEFGPVWHDELDAIAMAKLALERGDRGRASEFLQRLSSSTWDVLMKGAANRMAGT